MLPDLSARLEKAIEKKRTRQKLERDFLAVEAALREQSSRLTSLGARLEKEKVDVDRLEGAGLTALFYAVLGSREAQLEKERQELLAVQLQYGQAQHRVNVLKQEQYLLVQQISSLAGVEAEYEALLSEKEDLLQRSNHAVTGELLSSAEGVATLELEISEIAQAAQAGKDVLDALERVLVSLESAQSWGAWDMLGGGLLSTAAKHSRIDEARQGVHVVQAKMDRFQRELADVRRHVELKIDIGGLETFADYFFDGLIADWVVQSRIAASLELARSAKERIARAVAGLEAQSREARARVDELQARRAHLIEQT